MNVETWAVRPKKAEMIVEYGRRYCVESGKMVVSYVEDAVVLPVRRCDNPEFDFGLGGVVDSHGRYVPESASRELVGGGYEPAQLPDAELKTVVYCGYFQFHWGHFLMQSCNRLWYALDAARDVDEYVFAVDEGSAPPDIVGTNYEEFFRLLGIAGKVRFVSSPQPYFRIIIPQESFAITRFIRRGFADLFNGIRERAASGGEARRPGGRILLGRSSFAKAARMEMGLREIEEHFGRNGYEVVYPERMSLAALIQLMSSASEIVTFSGSLAHNLVFAPPGARITVIERYPYVNYFQTAVELAFGFRITYVDANAFICPVSPGLGPFIYCTNRYFDEYCRRRGLPLMPAPTETECRKMVRRFMRLHTREYDRDWKMPSYFEEHIPDMNDALADSEPQFGMERHCPAWFRLSLRLSPYILARTVYRGARSFLRRISFFI